MWQLIIEVVTDSEHGYKMTDRIELKVETLEQAIKLIETVQKCGSGDFIYKIKKIEEQKGEENGV